MSGWVCRAWCLCNNNTAETLISMLLIKSYICPPAEQAQIGTPGAGAIDFLSAYGIWRNAEYGISNTPPSAPYPGFDTVDPTDLTWQAPR